MVLTTKDWKDCFIKLVVCIDLLHMSKLYFSNKDSFILTRYLEGKILKKAMSYSSLTLICLDIYTHMRNVQVLISFFWKVSRGSPLPTFFCIFHIYEKKEQYLQVTRLSEPTSKKRKYIRGYSHTNWQEHHWFFAWPWCKPIQTPLR